MEALTVGRGVSVALVSEALSVLLARVRGHAIVALQDFQVALVETEAGP